MKTMKLTHHVDYIIHINISEKKAEKSKDANINVGNIHLDCF